MTLLLDRLRRGDILLSDGAMGTLLIERGLKPGECPELFGHEHQQDLEEITRAYLDAGADILQTNTFGASPLKLASYGLADRTEEINRAAVDVVRRVVEDEQSKIQNPKSKIVYVVACCGPSGQILKPYGDTDPEVIAASFERQVRILVETGVAAINFETMMDLAELVIAVRAAKAIAPSLPVMASATYEPRRKRPSGSAANRSVRSDPSDPSGSSFVTIMGNTIPHVVRALEEAGADIIASNCGNGTEMMIAIARELRAHTKLPISIRPNAGLPVITGDKTTYPETPEFMAAKLPELLDAGVSIIGGCCGTTPEHIRAFRRVLDTRASRKEP
jgi:5-methyltetrahydrofolate--homocysteine methyltransferase